MLLILPDLRCVVASHYYARVLIVDSKSGTAGTALHNVFSSPVCHFLLSIDRVSLAPSSELPTFEHTLCRTAVSSPPTASDDGMFRYLCVLWI